MRYDEPHGARLVLGGVVLRRLISVFFPSEKLCSSVSHPHSTDGRCPWKRGEFTGQTPR